MHSGEQFSVDQFRLRFSEIIIRPDFGSFLFFFLSPWEYNDHLLSEYSPNVSSWSVSTDVLADFFVLFC